MTFLVNKVGCLTKCGVYPPHGHGTSNLNISILWTVKNMCIVCFTERSGLYRPGREWFPWYWIMAKHRRTGAHLYIHLYTVSSLLIMRSIQGRRTLTKLKYRIRFWCAFCCWHRFNYRFGRWMKHKLVKKPERWLCLFVYLHVLTDLMLCFCTQVFVNTLL